MTPPDTVDNGPGTFGVPGPFSGYGGFTDDSNQVVALC